MKRYLTMVYCVLFGWWCTNAFAQITTSIEPVEPTLSDTIRLSLTMDSAPNVSDRPQLTVLQKEFDIVGTQQSMSYSMINGSAHAITQWVVLLAAKHSGQITVPAIQIGQEQSKPMRIVVKDDAKSRQTTDHASASATQGALILKGEVSKQQPYIGEEVIYTIRIYHNQPLVDTDYKPPVMDHALLFPLGDGQSYQGILDGKVYSIEEQQYAIFPQKSGVLPLTPASLSALIYQAKPERVRASAPSIALTVKAVPQDVSGRYPWFPAKEVRLTETYSSDESTLFSGSTLVRTVTLQAVGVPAELLPNLIFESDGTFKVYPEKPAIDNMIKQNDLLSKAVIKVTYLLDTPGALTIPPLSLKWFNTVTGKEENIILPAHALTIAANKGSAPLPKATIKSEDIHVTRDAAADKALAVAAPQLLYSQRLPWLIAIILGIGWIGTLLLWWLSPYILSLKSNRRLAWRRLKDACMQNQPALARSALLQWAILQWPDVNILNLSDLTRVVHDAALKKQLSLLSHALYSQDDKEIWRGDTLWHALSRYRAIRRRKKEKGNPLPPINPY